MPGSRTPLGGNYALDGTGDSGQGSLQLALRPSPEIRPIPYGLVSLWDMQKFYAKHYLDIGSQIQLVFDMFQVSETYESEIAESDIASLIKALNAIKDICLQIGLKTSFEVVQRSIDYLPNTYREWQRIVDVIEIEMQGIFFLYVPPHRSRFYEDDEILKSQTRAAFPHLSQEIRSAGNCYALGLPTACVFHCMRALEHPLKAMAMRVGLSWTSEQWHIIIEAIEAKIKDLRGSKKTQQRDEELHFLSQAAKEFFYFKDGWRNHVAHNKIVYEEPQARAIMEHIVVFADSLGTKLKEDPEII